MREKQLIQKPIHSLRTVSPRLYQLIIKKLEELNIHSYDVQINAIQKEEGIHVILKYGEKFNHTNERFFTADVIKNDSEEIGEFAKETGALCEEVLKSEYFKMMRP